MLTKEVAGTPLENAVFEIYTEKDELVDTITTAKDGKATSKLLEYVLIFAEEWGLWSIYLEVRVSNEAAIKLYHKYIIFLV